MRARVLALGVPQQAGLDRFLMEPSVEAESIFHAMAAITVASADEPIGAILVGPNVEHDGDDGLRALRRIDPALPVVLFDTNGQSSEATIHRNAFDDVLLPPLTSAGLSRAFERNVAIRDEPLPSDPPTPRPVEDHENAEVSSQPLRPSPAIPEEIASPSADDFPASKQPTAAQTQRQPDRPVVSPPEPQQRPATRLGDVDLVLEDSSISHFCQIPADQCGRAFTTVMNKQHQF